MKKENLKELLNRNEKLKQCCDCYCINELNTFKESKYLKEMSDLAKQLNFSIDCFFDFGKEDFNNIYIAFDIRGIDGDFVWAGDDYDGYYLSYSTAVISFIKHKYFKFLSWEDDEDFIETLEEYINDLKYMTKTLPH